MSICHLAALASRRVAVVALLAGLVSSPALSQAGAEGDAGERPSAFETLSEQGWRFVPLSQMLEHSQRERLTSRGMPRLLPLAMLPMQRSALWLGLSGRRSDGPGASSGVRVELRWSIPLDRVGGSVDASALRAR
jgi:hypothetical protein